MWNTNCNDLPVFQQIGLNIFIDKYTFNNILLFKRLKSQKANLIPNLKIISFKGSNSECQDYVNKHSQG